MANNEDMKNILNKERVSAPPKTGKINTSNSNLQKRNINTQNHNGLNTNNSVQRRKGASSKSSRIEAAKKNVGKKLASGVLEAAGAPKPLADMAGKGLVNKIEKRKNSSFFSRAQRLLNKTLDRGAPKENLSNEGEEQEAQEGTLDLLGVLQKNPIILLIVISVAFSVVFLVVLFSSISFSFLSFFGSSSSSRSGSSGSTVNSYIASSYKNMTGITIVNEDGSTETKKFEEYIAGVVKAECGGCGYEVMKAQAVLARSYALKTTDFGKKTIKNSELNQVYQTPSEESIRATQETAGEVLMYDGDIVTAYYSDYPTGEVASFPSYNNAGYACDEILCKTGEDGRNWCETVLYKTIDSNNLNVVEPWTFSMPETRSSNGSFWNGASLRNQGGHCYGMSQVGATYLSQEQGYTYDKLIETFFPDGVSIVNLNNVSSANPYITIGDYSFQTSNYDLIIGGLGEQRSKVYVKSKLQYPQFYDEYQITRDNVSQCPWYASGRAMEIIYSSNLPEDEKTRKFNAIKDLRGNGTEYNLNDRPNLKKYFMGSNNYEEPQPGSIISWRWENPDSNYGKAGHVGIIESVNYDNKTAVVSDGWCVKDNCGWNGVHIETRTWTFDQLYNYGNSTYKNRNYRFNGYIYLLPIVSN